MSWGRGWYDGGGGGAGMIEIVGGLTCVIDSGRD